MIPEDLIKVLDELKEKSINPRVLLINPNGQNPTGTICPMDRKQEIYKVKFLLIIRIFCQNIL